MATQWSDTTTHTKNEINNGNKYDIGDRLSLEALNITVENSLNAIRLAQNAQSVTNNGVSYNTQNATEIEKSISRKNIGLRYISSVKTKSFIGNKSIQAVPFSFKNYSGVDITISGEYVWSDGENVYYSNGTTQYMLNGNVWVNHTWVNLNNFYGNNIWSDGKNIYLSNATNHYIFNNGAWLEKTWNGFTNFLGQYIWSDGENIYYDNSTVHYKLNISTSTWELNSWNGYSDISGDNVWSDGENIFYNSYTNTNKNYILNTENSTWYSRSSNIVGNSGILEAFYGSNIFAFNGEIYYSGNNLYCLSKTVISKNENSLTATDYWINLGNNELLGISIWTDGYNCYCSNNNGNYLLLPKSSIK